MVYIIIEKIILRGPRSSSFWFPRNLSNHIYRQASTRDTGLEYRQITVSSQTVLRWCLGGVERVKTTENKIHWARLVYKDTQSDCRLRHSYTPTPSYPISQLSSADTEPNNDDNLLFYLYLTFYLVFSSGEKVHFSLRV